MSSDVFQFRLDELARRVSQIEKATNSIPVIRRMIEELQADVAEVKEDQKSVRRAMWGIAASIVTAAVVMTFSVLLLLG